MITVLNNYVNPMFEVMFIPGPAAPNSGRIGAGRWHKNVRDNINALHCDAAVHAKTFYLLRLLADANFHSGVALARELGVAPAAIRSGLRELEGLGLELVRARGRGYRLAEAYDCLDAAAVRAQLGPRAGDFLVELLDACDSTNTQLLACARAGAPSGSVLACELQSAGRGPRRDTWQSGLGGNLPFSWCGASAAAPPASPACRWRRAWPWRVRLRPWGSKACSSSGRTTCCTPGASWEGY